MARKWGKFDCKSFEKLAKRFEDVDKISEQLMVDILYEIANRILRKTKKRTPVGDYGTHEHTISKGKNKGKTVIKKNKGSHGLVGGNLRRNWYITDVKKKGKDLYIEIYNPIEYAPYVEYGHRQEVGRYVPALGKRLKEPWVEGKFMLTISIKEAESLLPKIADKHIQKVLGELFEDD